MRHSKQRDLILASFVALGHPTAEEVYSHLKKDCPSLSLGTVYRNLRQLEEHGLILTIPTKNGVTCYDKTASEHGHLICTACGGVSDLSDFSLSSLDRRLAEMGFAPSRRDLVIYGCCKDCQSKKA